MRRRRLGGERRLDHAVTGDAGARAGRDRRVAAVADRPVRAAVDPADAVAGDGRLDRPVRARLLAPAYQRGLAALQGAAALAGPAFDAWLSAASSSSSTRSRCCSPPSSRPSSSTCCGWPTSCTQAGGQRVERLSADELCGSSRRSVRRHRWGDRARRTAGAAGALTAGLHRAVVARGVEVLEGAPVTAMTRDGGRG